MSAALSLPVKANPLAPLPVCSLENHVGNVYCLCLSVDAAFLATGGADGCVIIRDTVDLCISSILSRLESAIRSLSFSSDSKLLCCAAEQGKIEIWLIANNECVLSHTSNNAAEINAVAFHPIHPILAYATESKDHCVITLLGCK